MASRGGATCSRPSDHVLRPADEHDGYFVSYLSERIGSSSDRQLLEHSPAHVAARARAPVLLTHGAQDTFALATQSEAMAAALKKAGGRGTLASRPGEDHWLSSSRARVQVRRELDRFLGANPH